MAFIRRFTFKLLGWLMILVLLRMANMHTAVADIGDPVYMQVRGLMTIPPILLAVLFFWLGRKKKPKLAFRH